MGVYGGQHYGFMYAGRSSKEMGIVRAMQNNWYNLHSLRNGQTNPSTDYPGVYFWNDGNNINIQFTFEDLSESQYQMIKKLMNDKKMHQLIFDEAPNLIYPVVMTNLSKIEATRIEFLEAEQLISRYRGIGNFQLLTHEAYLRNSTHFMQDLTKLLDTEVILDPQVQRDLILWPDLRILNNDLDQRYELNSSKHLELIKKTQLQNKEYKNYRGECYCIYNQSMSAEPLDLYISLKNTTTVGRSIMLTNTVVTKTPLCIFIPESQIVCQSNDAYIRINSKDWMISGYDKFFNPTGTLYNKNIREGNFFNIAHGFNEINVHIDGISGSLLKRDYRNFYN